MGDVQGYGFRQAIADKANEQGVTGWVRNLPDGRVEAVLEGPRDEVYRVVGLCRAGPKGAKVQGVQVDREPPRNEKTFKIK
jgi:acylphosphatase